MAEAKSFIVSIGEATKQEVADATNALVDEFYNVFEDVYKGIRYEVPMNAKFTFGDFGVIFDLDGRIGQLHISRIDEDKKKQYAALKRYFPIAMTFVKASKLFMYYIELHKDSQNDGDDRREVEQQDNVDESD